MRTTPSDLTLCLHLIGNDYLYNAKKLYYAKKMKFASFFITIALLFSSCEKSKDSIPQQEGEQTVKTVNRIEKADAPALEPDLVISNAFVGNTFAYKRVFTEVFEDHEIPRLPPPGAGPEYEVKRDENDTGLTPVSRGRLRLKKDNSPFSGKVFRHYLSGALEHHAIYKEGFRTGTALWWNEDGNITKAATGWGFDHEELELSEIASNPISGLQIEMRTHGTIPADSSLFCGTEAEWAKWSDKNSEGFTFCLENGENLNGEVKIYSNDGFLNSIKKYKDGLLDGESSTFHQNGIQSRSVYYRAGLKHGQEIWWSDNGFKSYVANHVDGKLHGKSYNWDREGFLVSEVEFDSGNEIRP